MLRSSLAFADVNLRRTLRPNPTFSFPAYLSRSSRCITTSPCTALKFPIQRSRHHCLSCFSSSSSEHSTPISSSPQQSSSKVLTLPTVLTLGRVAAVPILVASFYVDSWWGTTATTSIFIVASITDWLDGYIARKMRLGSAFGAFLDPVADKLMVAATLILLCTRPVDIAVVGTVPWLLTVPSIAIIGREITMSAVREWAASQMESFQRLLL